MEFQSLRFYMGYNSLIHFIYRKQKRYCWEIKNYVFEPLLIHIKLFSKDKLAKKINSLIANKFN